ncbi:MAG TPA: DUF1365 family protein [Solirubrobacter sp.]|nr:DUF1365 family protein [Solirubrobacter sp.]
MVGSGVSGLVAAHVAARSAEVTLYEADARLGGHADTHRVRETLPGGVIREHAIDTGFIVHNPDTYPVLLRLFDELGVATQPSEMSMSISDEATGLEWAGARGLAGLFPSVRTALTPRYLAMLTEIPRFHRRAWRLVERPGADANQTLREFLHRGRFSRYFVRHFMEPLVAAVWSCEPTASLDYPARYLFTFLQHHGMLGIFGSPRWYTVAGGSHDYVRRVVAGVDHVRSGTKVTSVRETPDGVDVIDGTGRVARFDAVVVATHPDQALALLDAPSRAQREVLGQMPYSTNVALLHTDASLLPRAARARASWNFRRLAGATGETTVTYDLTRLQRLDTATRYLVTLGGEGVVDPALVIDRMAYAHPRYDPASVSAQRRLPEIGTDRIAFAGAYHGWGFHEDGARSGLAAAERVGLTWPEPGVVWPARYAVEISHLRRQPVRRAFTHRSHTWVVDLDELPDHGLLGRFEARDHLGDPGRSLRENVVAFLAQHDVEIGRGRVLLAANPRAFGFCFNPISVFWCHDEAGRLAATVVEVHNTYGDRHAYLLHPDAQGRAHVDKRMYVSPFHGTDGRYDLVVPPPGDRIDLSVTLTTDDGARFSARLAGRRSDVSVWRTAPTTLRGWTLIHGHGIWLWLRRRRRMPVRPRPAHHQEGVS